MLPLARQALARAHAPYSGFRVGACLRSASGRLYAGCNVENAAYPQGQCAESTAIGAMVTGGDTVILEVLVASEGPETCPPCGGCRQRLREFASPEVAVHLVGPEGLRLSTTVGALLPLAFDRSTLPARAGGTVSHSRSLPGSRAIPEVTAGFLPQELIRKKRDGAPLDDDEIARLCAGLVDGSVSDGQAAAFAMAVFFRGMTRRECVALTHAMTGSGAILAWSRPSLPGPVLDKHSTGGVGDKVSLILAPVVAACGGFVPMVSGRGLGHTGGTVDKLASIPGYEVGPGVERFQAAVRTAGCAIVGQTAELAPADRRLYAVRDVTATVESIPLITASILSKKLAAGLAALVMDVKVGSGAFAATAEEAEALADSLVAVADQAGLPTTALLTDMSQALGEDVGNAVEVLEAIDFLTGRRRDARLRAVSVALAAELLLLGRLAETPDEAVRQVERALDAGAAAERFGRMVADLGGPADLVEHPGRHLLAAPVRAPAWPGRAGIVTGMDARAVGLAVVALGGGRRRATDAVDPAVGLTGMAGIGHPVGPDRPLATVHARTVAEAEAAAAALRSAMVVGEETPAVPPPVRARRPARD